MTDRTSELVTDYSKTFDARTYDQKMAAVIQELDSKIDHLVHINAELVEVVGSVVERVIYLENRIAMADAENATLKERN